MDEQANVVTQPDPPTCILKNSENNEPAKKKKLKKQSCTSKDKTSTTGFNDALGNDSVRLFITFWKDKCCQLTPTEVQNALTNYVKMKC